MQAKNMLDFINSLELPPADLVHVGRKATVPTKPMILAGVPTTDGVATADPSKPSGFVDSGSLVSFVAGVGQQNQADVLNSTLLAQLAANKKYDREKDTVNWYAFYRNVIENVGWVVQEFQFEQYNVSGASVTTDKIVAEVLAAIATGNDLAVITSVLNAIKGLSRDDNRLVLFDHASHSSKNGNFQISSCAESGGVVVMKIGAFYFSTTQNVDRVLWFDFSSSNSNIYKGAQAMTLNNDVYSQVRSTIVTKLGDNAKNFIANLDI